MQSRFESLNKGKACPAICASRRMGGKLAVVGGGFTVEAALQQVLEFDAVHGD